MSFTAVFAIEIVVMCGVATVLYLQQRRYRLERQWYENPDPAAVQMQRQLHAEGKFRRKILYWTPHDHNSDHGHLECSHTTYHSLSPGEKERETETNCIHCAAEWLRKARTSKEWKQ